MSVGGNALASAQVLVGINGSTSMHIVGRASIVAVVALMSVGAAEAKGCIKGAIVGGVAGHLAGRHATVGAIGGCLVGRHLAKQKQQDRRDPRGYPRSGYAYQR